jgi:predicted dithiol-disulfide oxidoreductase (DUF899 family)
MTILMICAAAVTTPPRKAIRRIGEMIVQRPVIELLFDPSPCVKGNRFTFCRMFHDPANSIGKAVDVLFRRKKAGISVFHELRDTRMVGTYDSQPRSHRLHQCHRDTLDITIACRNAWQNEHV